MSEHFFIAGIDGGGTKTECALVDQDGCCIGMGCGGPSNINYTSVPEVLNSYRAAIESAIGMSGSLKVDFVACTHRAAALPEVISLIGELLGGEVRRYSEGEAALGCAGLFDRFGIAHVAGTGSSTFGFPPDGDSLLIGGWGALLGDEGSAYDIAVKGLRAAVRAFDGRGMTTILLDRAISHFAIAGDRESFLQIASTCTRDQIARFAVSVTTAAEEGDCVAQGIVDDATHEHANSIITMARRIFTPEDIFPVAIHGGVMSDERIASEVTRLVKEKYPNADVRLPIHSPGVGLALFAREVIE